MNILKNEFEFDEHEKKFMFFPFCILPEDFIQIDWDIFNSEFNFVKSNFQKIERMSIDAILKHAKEIKLFSKEEFEDLEFDIFTIDLKIKKSKIIGYTSYYAVDEDENSKFYFKDVYGVWTVNFEKENIINVYRE